MTATLLATLLAIVVNAPAQAGPERRDRDRDRCPRDVDAAFVQLNNALRLLGDDVDRVGNERDRRKLREDLTAAIRASERARHQACDVDRRPGGPPVVVVPAPLPEPRLMSPAAFNEFLTAVKRESFDDGRTRIVNAAMSGDICVTSDQAKAVLAEPSFTAGRMSVARALLPRIVDVERSYLLSEAFTFESDKRELAKLLPTAGTHPACQRLR